MNYLALGDVDLKEIMAKVFQASFVKMLAVVFGFLFSVYVSKNLGVEGVGHYAILLTWISILSVFCKLGFDNVIIREVSRLNPTVDRGAIGGVVLKCLSISFCTSSLIVGAYFGFVYFSSLDANLYFGNDIVLDNIAYAVFLITPLCMISLVSQALRGLKKTWQGMFVHEFFPVVVKFILVLLACSVFYGLSLSSVVVSTVISSYIAAFVGCYIYYRHVPKRDSLSSKYSYSYLITSGFPLLMVSAVNVLNQNLDILMLGLFSTPDEVGIYSVAIRLSQLITLILLVFNTIVGPKFGEFLASGQLSKLKEVAQQTTFIMTFLALIIFVLFSVFGRQLLMIWGGEFVEGYYSLLVLSFAQLINVGVGPVAFLLIASHNDRVVRNSVFFVLICNFVLNYYLVPIYGAEGAAIATCLAIVTQNLYLLLVVESKFGFWMCALKFYKKGLS